MEGNPYQAKNELDAPAVAALTADAAPGAVAIGSAGITTVVAELATGCGRRASDLHLNHDGSGWRRRAAVVCCTAPRCGGATRVGQTDRPISARSTPASR